jgi:hypothetical protein
MKSFILPILQYSLAELPARGFCSSRILVTAITLWISISCSQAQEETNLNDVLKALETRAAARLDLRATITWQQKGMIKFKEADDDLLPSKSGVPVFVDFDASPTDFLEESLLKDKNGRIRIDSKRFTLTKSGAKEPQDYFEETLIYDGEKALRLHHSPTRNKLGLPLEPNSKIDPGYFTAQIWAVEQPGAISIKHPRDAMTFIDQLAIGGMQIARSKKMSLELKRNPDSPTLYELTFSTGDESDEARQNYKILFEKANAMSVVRLEILAPGLKSSTLAECSYIQSSTGEWFPHEGLFKIIALQTKKPSIELKYKVLDIQVGAKTVGPESFRIALPKDTMVVDGRYKSTYRIGSEDTIEDDLELLRKSIEERQQGLSRPWYQNRFIALAALLNISIIVALLWRILFPRVSPK